MAAAPMDSDTKASKGEKGSLPTGSTASATASAPAVSQKSVTRYAVVEFDCDATLTEKCYKTKIGAYRRAAYEAAIASLHGFNISQRMHAPVSVMQRVMEHFGDEDCKAETVLRGLFKEGPIAHHSMQPSVVIDEAALVKGFAAIDDEKTFEAFLRANKGSIWGFTVREIEYFDE